MSLKLTTWARRIWDSVRTKWTGGLWVVGGLVLLSLLWWAVIEMPRWQVNRLMFSTDEVTRFELENEARRTVWQFMLGFGGLVALFVAWRRVRAMDKTAEAAQKNAGAALEQVKLVERGQITERFTRAIDQLGATGKIGNPALEIRLGGIYALERIARDSVDDHWNVMEVLTAYVRNNSLWREPEETGAVPGTDATDLGTLSSRKPDIQAILTVLGRREGSEEREGDRRLDLSGTDLRGADMSGARLERANFNGAHLEEADFSEAHLERATLYKAHVEGAALYKANLEEAFLVDVHLEAAELDGANLRQVMGLRRKQLMSANNWQHAYRDDRLACGEEIPKHPDEEEEKSKQNANEV